MKYVSTRGQAPKLDFDDVLLTGLAEDGGLYLPEFWPQISKEKMQDWAKLSYADLAVEVMEPFVHECIDRKTLTELCHKAYGRFRHEAVTPIKQLGSQVWLQELFQGPTLAFKDCALQMLGLFFEHTLAKKDRAITIIGATSGDTGSAAIEACRDRQGIEIFILFPDGKVRQSRIHKYDPTFERNWPSLPGSKTTAKPETRTDTRTDTSKILAADLKTYVYNAQALCDVAEEETWNAQLLALQATSMLMSTAIECAYAHQ